MPYPHGRVAVTAVTAVILELTRLCSIGSRAANTVTLQSRFPAAFARSFLLRQLPSIPDREQVQILYSDDPEADQKPRPAGLGHTASPQ